MLGRVCLIYILNVSPKFIRAIHHEYLINFPLFHTLYPVGNIHDGKIEIYGF
jgi:hypothetical protein